ncbi:MAG TPA: YhjD/YihY/BrkB family envelope integrity protein [Candidatus Binatia bacterium]|nr:YhjD/YihY/BrkB family envelope integrity protein [Candidatus Binatia bacterium]
MSSTARITQFAKQDLWTTDLATVPLFQRVGIQALRLVLAVGLEFRHRLLDARAAGLVYTTLLSLVPFLAVMFSVLKAFGVHHEIEPLLTQSLEPLGPKGVEITATIIGFVDNLKVGVLGIVGVAGLFYTTYSLIDKIEQALNAIWMVRQGRSWGRKFADYLSAVLVGPVLVFTAFGLLASMQSNTVVQRLMEIQPFGSLLLWTAALVPFLMLCSVFTFFYKFIPNTQVNIGSAFVGGIAAAILWGIAGEVFAKFVAASAKYSAIYSSFAVLILFLLWLYAAWLIVLIGAQFSFFHQHPTAYLSRLLWQQGTHAFRERLALNVLVLLARRYLKGERPLRPSELALELHLPVSLVEEQVENLVESGWIGVMHEPKGVSLLTPPELISVKDVLDAAREGNQAGVRVPIDPQDPVHAVLRRRDEAVQQALAGQTLRSLVVEQTHQSTA